MARQRVVGFDAFEVVGKEVSERGFPISIQAAFASPLGLNMRMKK